MNWTRWTFAIVACLLAASCLRRPEHESRKDKSKKEEVTLPPRPNLAPRKAAEKYADGAFSVEGFLRHAREMLNQDVTVKGFVLAVEACKAGPGRCETVPHLVLVDDLSNPRRRAMVVSDPAEMVLAGYPTQSNQTLTGKVAMWSPNGRLVDLDGVLVMRKPEPPKETVPAAKD